mmetsp:Transcript_32118/g.91078  ORF Transcript_32118/g.91078 Transcript_32118/m.91078 type:complete len:402 (-) Transcript_32118:449-1654(-)
MRTLGAVLVPVVVVLALLQTSSAADRVFGHPAGSGGTNRTTASCKPSVDYVASKLEVRWRDNVGAWQPGAGKGKATGRGPPGWQSGSNKNYPDLCVAAGNDHKRLTSWTEAVKAANKASKPGMHGVHGTFDPAIFSYFDIVTEDCRRMKSYIEPLAVALRHPLFPCFGSFGSCLKTKGCGIYQSPERWAMIFDLNYLLLPFREEMPKPPSLEAGRRGLFLDLGSTYYDINHNSKKVCGRYVCNDNLKWFVDSFRARNIEFDHIYGWEMETLDPKRYWSHVPADIKPKLHFYNVPCQSDPSHPDNPWNHLRATARKDDYVVVKLDIDNNAIEVALIMQLLDDPQLAALIDELFWENHVGQHPMEYWGWGRLKSLPSGVSTMKDSYSIFTRLRKLGIRAHSWV